MQGSASYGSGSSGNQKKKLALVFLLPVFLISAGALAYFFPSASNQGFAPDQPIPFSHKLHAGTNKIQCQYCHSTAEKSYHASIPSVSTCMNCHRVVKTDSPWIKQITAAYEAGKPIEWVRIHELPDHAHFPHKRHLAAGLACQTCHGEVQEMDKVSQYAPLTMGWCIDCHRGVTTPKQVLAKYPKNQPVASTNCVACHY